MLLNPVGHCVGGASPAEQEQLWLSAREKVLRLERLRYVGEKARVLERSVLPLHRVAGVDIDRARHLTLTEIADQLGLRLGRATERLSIVTAPPDVADVLAVDPTHELLQIERVVTTVDGAPFEWRIVHVMQLRS